MKRRRQQIRSLMCMALTGIGLWGTVSVPAWARNPVPVIDNPLVPDVVLPGGSGLTLTINGTGFAPGAVVRWNGSPRATTFVSSSRLTAAIPASDIVTATTVPVTVLNPGPGGGLSNAAFFDVTFSAASISFRGSPFQVDSQPNSVNVADFNRDGILDIAVSNYVSNKVSILLGNGDGTFQAHVDYATGLGPDTVVIGDFNADGNPDLAVRNQGSNSVSVLLGNGDGTFRPAANFAVGRGTASSRVAVGDFNGDGNLDLAASNYNDNTVSILLGNGDGTFQKQVVYAGGPEAAALAVGDVNDDGKLDLAIVNANNNDTVSILLGNGDGSFQAPVPYSTGSAPAWVNIADLNGDGFPDLVVANTNSSTISILLGVGDGTFHSHVDYAVPSGAIRSDVADLNGDGKLDVVVASGNSSNVISVLLGNGDGTFQSPVKYATGSQPGHVAVGDFNNDGRLDVAVADIGASAVSALLQATMVLSPPRLRFATQLVGTTSAADTVDLTNVGPISYAINSIAISGTSDFGETNTCGSSLGAGAGCTISVTFAPTQSGSRTGTLSITDSAPGSPQNAKLQGVGTFLELSTNQLSFPSETVGSSSAPESVTLTNTGTASLMGTFSIVGTDPGDFTYTTTCTQPLPGGASCSISVTFTPKATGSRSAILRIGNAVGFLKVTLTGTGT